MENAKQFRTSRYYVKKNGDVFKHYPGKVYKAKWINKKGETRLHGHTSMINGIDYAIERWKKMKPTKQNNGYLVFNFWDKSIIEDKYFFNTSVHQMVAECYLGPCPKGFEVDHIDGDKDNNHISNLQYLTPAENRAKGIIQERYKYKYIYAT